MKQLLILLSLFLVPKLAFSQKLLISDQSTDQLAVLAFTFELPGEVLVYESGCLVHKAKDTYRYDLELKVPENHAIFYTISYRLNRVLLHVLPDTPVTERSMVHDTVAYRRLRYLD